MRRLVREHRIEIVEFSNWEGFGLLFLTTANTPVVVRLSTSSREAQIIDGSPPTRWQRWDVRRERWLVRAAKVLVTHSDAHRRLMPVESRIYRANWSSLRNAFSEAGQGWGTTKQTSWFGTRIDHILYSSAWRCRKAWVGPAMGSDHRPLIADLALEDY